MKNNNTIMSAMDYSLDTLKTLKTAMVNTDHPQHELYWAIGAVIGAMTANLLHISKNVILGPTRESSKTSRDDIVEIQAEFNKFLTQMIKAE